MKRTEENAANYHEDEAFRNDDAAFAKVMGMNAVSHTVESADSSQLWTPQNNEGTKVDVILDGNVLVTDKRRVTPQSVEATFKANQEALRAPLSPDEQARAIDTLSDAIAKKMSQGERSKTLTNQELSDLDGDRRALSRIKQLVGGDYISRGNDATNQSKGLTIGERLDDLVKQYAKLVPENFSDEGSKHYIGSMGGTVEVSESGQVHHGGYNNGLLYNFARARQIWNTLESNPKMIREAVLDPSKEGGPDIRWITEQPVLLTAADMGKAPAPQTSEGVSLEKPAA